MNTNNPLINKKYNYLYKITNTINNKIYIGVHRTDNINDNYMGSGKILKRSQSKYGIKNFTKEILHTFPTYMEALDEERRIVTTEFIERKDNYNIKEGGFGSCKWSKEVIQHLSDKGKKRWNDPIFVQKMLRSLKSEERKTKIGNKFRTWMVNNPEKLKEKMNKINKDPIKIEKTRQKHLGTKRNTEARKNISKGLQLKINTTPGLKEKISGKNMIYIFNKSTDTIKRISRNDPIPDNWVLGSRPMKGKRNYDICKNLVFAHNPITLETHRYSNILNIPINYIMGRPKNGRL